MTSEMWNMYTMTCRECYTLMCPGYPGLQFDARGLAAGSALKCFTDNCSGGRRPDVEMTYELGKSRNVIY